MLYFRKVGAALKQDRERRADIFKLCFKLYRGIVFIFVKTCDILSKVLCPKES